ncbi:hypothetical protein ACFL0K_00130 [Patescibacteria group bacterium]
MSNRKVKLLTYGTIPCWYELSWDKNNLAIIFKLHKNAILNNGIGFAKNFPSDAPIVEHLHKSLGLNEFCGNLDTDFGFGGVLKHKGEEGEFVVFSVALPNIRKTTNNKCPICNDNGDEGCLFCGGSGVEWRFDHDLLFNISASFVVMFTAFGEYSDYDTECEFPQLMTVDLTIEKRSVYGACIGGKFGIDLVKWMSTFNPNTKITEMIEAMKCAYGQMSGIVPDKYERFLASIDYENGWLNVSCPGNACGLNPSNGNVCAGEGYGFSPHNTDTPLQQLTLLAGLAALHDKARKEMP